MMHLGQESFQWGVRDRNWTSVVHGRGGSGEVEKKKAFPELSFIVKQLLKTRAQEK